jgi:putative acetyltransferase
MAITFRELLPDDYDAAMELWNRAPGVRTTETRALFQRFLDRNPDLSGAACLGEKLIGAVMCGHDSRRGYLYHLAVDAAYQRQGIAKRLVETCLQRLAALGIEKCSAFLFTHNTSGREFWLQLDWRERVDLIVMAKELW